MNTRLFHLVSAAGVECFISSLLEVVQVLLHFFKLCIKSLFTSMYKYQINLCEIIQCLFSLKTCGGTAWSLVIFGIVLGATLCLFRQEKVKFVTYVFFIVNRISHAVQNSSFHIPLGDLSANYTT